MSVMGLIKRNFKSIDIEEFNLLYKAYIRPHLEYCIQVWSPSVHKYKYKYYITLHYITLIIKNENQS